LPLTFHLLPFTAFIVRVCGEEPDTVLILMEDLG